MKRGSVFAFGDKLWVDVHLLKYLTGKNCGEHDCEKMSYSLKKITFPFGSLPLQCILPFYSR